MQRERCVRILLIDNFDSFTFNLYQMMQGNTELEIIIKRNDAITFDEIQTMAPLAIVLSPGPGHPKNESDIGVGKDIIERWDELPNAPMLFGVCLGMQTMAYLTGNQVVKAPTVIHGKTSEVEIIAQSPLLKELANPYTVMRYHSLIVDNKSLTKQWQVTSRTKEETTLIPMSLSHVDRPWHGVQYHPESIGTPEGDQILKNMLAMINVG